MSMNVVLLKQSQTTVQSSKKVSIFDIYKQQLLVSVAWLESYLTDPHKYQPRVKWQWLQCTKIRENSSISSAVLKWQIIEIISSIGLTSRHQLCKKLVKKTIFNIWRNEKYFSVLLIYQLFGYNFGKIQYKNLVYNDFNWILPKQ